VNLYRNTAWLMDNTKMEAASFAMLGFTLHITLYFTLSLHISLLTLSLHFTSHSFDQARLKYQVSDPDAYFVHHMSMYEHVNHKAYGFADAKNKSLILAKASLHGECGSLAISKEQEYMAFIPFYGGTFYVLTS
jgi:hypothetical protein